MLRGIYTITRLHSLVHRIPTISLAVYISSRWLGPRCTIDDVHPKIRTTRWTWKVQTSAESYKIVHAANYFPAVWTLYIVYKLGTTHGFSSTLHTCQILVTPPLFRSKVKKRNRPRNLCLYCFLGSYYHLRIVYFCLAHPIVLPDEFSSHIYHQQIHVAAISHTLSMWPKKTMSYILPLHW